jgi:hypothetical protein
VLDTRVNKVYGAQASSNETYVPLIGEMVKAWEQENEIVTRVEDGIAIRA